MAVAMPVRQGPTFDEYELGIVLTDSLQLTVTEKTSHTCIGLCSRTRNSLEHGLARTIHLGRVECKVEINENVREQFFFFLFLSKEREKKEEISRHVKVTSASDDFKHPTQNNSDLKRLTKQQ